MKKKKPIILQVRLPTAKGTIQFVDQKRKLKSDKVGRKSKYKNRGS